MLEKEREILMNRIAEQDDEIRKTRLERMNELAKIAEFGRLSQGLFHDLMTPLTSVILHTEELKKVPKDKMEEVQARLEKAVSASRRMADYIRTVRSALHGEHGIKNFNIEEELQDILDIFSFEIRRVGASIIIQDSHAPISYHGDPMKIRQILSNLISNALDSFEDQTKPKTIKMSLEKADDSITITISDTGSGITPENLNKIFDPFFTTKSSKKGSGIGLATVKTLVEHDLHGKINVESKIGEGSKFTVVFPFQN